MKTCHAIAWQVFCLQRQQGHKGFAPAEQRKRPIKWYFRRILLQIFCTYGATKTKNRMPFRDDIATKILHLRSNKNEESNAISG
jgi:hypothetical protein